MEKFDFFKNINMIILGAKHNVTVVKKNYLIECMNLLKVFFFRCLKYFFPLKNRLHEAPHYHSNTFSRYLDFQMFVIACVLTLDDL